MEKITLCKLPTPVEYIGREGGNQLYIKRDDLTDLAFGGNKVRKLEYFLDDAIQNGSDCIITYGGYQSNHCRITAAAARKFKKKCVLILAETEEIVNNANYLLYSLFDVDIVWVSPENVPTTIQETMELYTSRGFTPYFIQGGGHGNLGTHAYVEAYNEIIEQQIACNVNFDYIFHASGTGTTQAGLQIGNMLNNFESKIIGISVARNEKRGKEVIYKSIRDYCNEFKIALFHKKEDIVFDDAYIGKGYSDIYEEIPETIKYVAKNYGLLLDPIYTGKAFYGMLNFIEKENIQNKNILFIHTGGTPLLFSNTEIFEGS